MVNVVVKAVPIGVATGLRLTACFCAVVVILTWDLIILKVNSCMNR